MQARAAVAVARDGGRDRLTTLRSDPPLTFRSTPLGVHLVGTSAGPLAGDDLGVAVTVGPGARLTVRSAAATLAQPGVRAEPSLLRIEVTVGEGGRLVWVPEPTVAVRGCDHETRARIALGEGATLVWRDEVVLGRHAEAPGSLLSRLAIDRPGGPLLRNDLAVGPRWPGSLGPAGAGAGTRAVGTVVIVGPDAAALPAGPLALAGGGPGSAGARGAVLPLVDRDAVLVTVVAPSAGVVSAALDALLAERA